MPVVTFHHEHRSIEVEPGTNLRRLMLHVGVPPYRWSARILNCRGHNLCGTCAVEVIDGKGAAARSQEEDSTLKGNLAVAHLVDKNIRLACQTTITGDMTVKTHPLRPVDWAATRQRFTLLGIATVFVLIFAAMFVYLFLDMTKKF
jgi:ferredoxin